jgi:hypothetical protein
MTQKLHNALLKALQEFIEEREKHGGILLPNRTIAESTFRDVMIEVGLHPKPAELSQTDKGLYYYKESDGQRARRLLKDKLGSWHGKQLHEMSDNECYECLKFVQETTGVYYI